MKGHIHELWNDVGIPEEYHVPDHRDIMRRVDAQLDDIPRERKRYMRQKLRLAAAVAAAVLALSGVALGAAFHLDALTANFRGDTSSAENLLERRPRSVQDENYTFTVESSVSDGRNAYLVIRADALTEQSAQKLMDEYFVNMDTFSIYPVKDSSAPLPEDLGVEEKYGVHIPGATGGWSTSEVLAARTATSRTWRADAPLPEGDFPLIRVRLCYMEYDQVVEVPLTPAESITVAVGATGQGLPTFENAEGGPITVDQVTLSAFTCRVQYTRHDRTETKPRIFFRMADGTVRTQSQMMQMTSGERGPVDAVMDFQFFEVLDLSQLKSLIVFGREFPLDGSACQDVSADPALEPFQIPLMPPLAEGDGYAIPVRALCDGLGASYTWDSAARAATLTYRDVTLVLTPGSKTALANGQPVVLNTAVGIQDGEVSAPYQFFEDYWGIDCFVYRTKTGDTIDWHNWIIIP